MKRHILVVATACTVLCAPLAAAQSPPVPVVFGESWDGVPTGLQSIMDFTYGAGNINCETDYIGAKEGDLDPWFWVEGHFTTYLVREIAGNANRNTLGWYVETGTKPVIDGVNDGVVFDGPSGAGAMAVIELPNVMTKFGFYLNPNGPLGATNAPEPELFFTNRLYNDQGPDGSGAIHVPAGGDVQAIVFDVSQFTQPNTWLVCFEDLDSGAHPGPQGSADTDNDFNDFIFEVTAFGATPTRPLTFGGLKWKFRN